MKTIALIVGVSVALASQAQVSLERSVVASAGFSSPTLSFTIGEPVTETAPVGSIVLTQGFQQPDTVLRVGIDAIADASMGVQLYPNPTSNTINLKFTNPIADAAYAISVRNVLGQECLSLAKLFAPSSASIDLRSLAAGLYYLSLVDGQNRRTIIKFQKID